MTTFYFIIQIFLANGDLAAVIVSEERYPTKGECMREAQDLAWTRWMVNRDAKLEVECFLEGVQLPLE